MTKKAFSTFAVALGMALGIAPSALASENVILRFNGVDGANPVGGLVADAKGNLYGTSLNGGKSKCNSSPCPGLVFELSPAAGGGWTETVLHVFTGGSEGANPAGTLILDSKGNLYGTIPGGSLSPYGLVFQLSPRSSGSWKETVLHTFSGGQDGQVPHGAIALDAQGNVYGTTNSGGTNDAGIVYELSPQPNGSWTETILHVFGGSGDAGTPFGGITLDSHGNLFGAVTSGGTNGVGAIYELSPNGNGQWTETILHSLSLADGTFPESPLTFDSSGNLYGSTLNEGGAFRYGGTVFQLAPESGGSWTFTVVHAFGKGTDGYDPTPGVTVDAKGNVYGTTLYGGSGCYADGYGGCGIVFELSPQASGRWNETILHAFESASDGSQSNAGLIIDSAGHLYGTTYYGGSRFGFGTVFEILP